MVNEESERRTKSGERDRASRLRIIRPASARGEGRQVRGLKRLPYLIKAQIGTTEAALTDE
jgi:hypothetical protein